MSTQYASNYPNAPAVTNSSITRTMWGIATVWFAGSAALGASGSLAEHPLFIGPLVVVPLIVFAVVFAASPGLRAWAFALDTRALVFCQAVRTGGIAFLAVYAVGQLNGKFALWAGLLDCAVGLSAPFAAQYLTPTRTAMQRRLLIAWMAPGVLDFLVAIFLARMARVGDTASMAALNMLPLSMITTFGVPLALIAYFILGAHLWQQRGRA